MKLLVLLKLSAASSFYAWALREINLTHPDVPAIVLRKHAIDEAIGKLYA